MHKFFVEPSQIEGNRIIITGGDVNHIKNVLRMKIGEEIAVSNGLDDKEYRCGIESFGEDKVVCTLHFIRENGVELPSEVYLFQSLPKADKMEFIIQKAVELGVYEIIPVAAGRCVVKLDAEKERGRLNRWRGIAEAAAKQCRRAVIPEIKPVMDMEDAVDYSGQLDVRLIPYELAEDMAKTKELIGNIRAGESVGIFIGPEGGFTEKEVAYAVKGGAAPITLGKRILRTETAAVAVLSWLMYHFED